MIKKLIISFLLLSFFFLAGMDYPPRGTDYNSYRCSGSLVSKGDHMRDVIDTCGSLSVKTKMTINLTGSSSVGLISPEFIFRIPKRPTNQNLCCQLLTGRSQL